MSAPLTPAHAGIPNMSAQQEAFPRLEEHASALPSDHPTLPAWAVGSIRTDRAAGNVRALLDLAEHGARRLRAQYGDVPATHDPPLPMLGSLEQAYPGLCLLAACATVAHTPMHHALARGVGKAASRIHAAGQLRWDDADWQAACNAIRMLPDVSVSGWTTPASTDLSLLCTHLYALAGDVSPPIRAALVDVAVFLTRAIALDAEAAAATPPPVVSVDQDTPRGDIAPKTPDAPEDAAPPLPDDRLAQALPSTPVEAIRSRAQHLDIADPDVIHPIEFRLLMEQLGVDRDPITLAVAGASLLAGTASYHLDEWRVAATAHGVDPSVAPTWIVLDPPEIHVANRINASLPPAPAGSTAVAATAIPLPLHPGMRGFEPLMSLATPRVDGALMHADEVAQADKHLRRLRERLDLNVTRKRLCNVLPSAIRATADDEIIVAYLSGKAMDTRLAPRLHYRQVPVSHLQWQFLEAATQVQRSLGNDMGEALMNLNIARDGFVGSLLCPDPDAVRKWTAALLSPIKAPMRGQPTPVRICTWHNAFTLYAMQFLQFALGTRPTERGIVTCWPDEHGRVAIADKIKNDIRLLPLSRTAHAQWMEYASHRNWIIQKLRLEDAPNWFFLEFHQGLAHPTSVTPNSLHRMSRTPLGDKAGWLVDNAGRHALASTLGISTWPGHRIALWMGQATLGDEPGARYACHTPNFTGKELRAIDGHLARSGFVVIRGLGHG